MKEIQEKKILEILEAQQYASVDELSEALFISSSTVRRALEALQTKGLVTRTHGGVKINSDNNFSPSFTFRIHQNSFEKKNSISCVFFYLPDADSFHANQNCVFPACFY